MKFFFWGDGLNWWKKIQNYENELAGLLAGACANDRQRRWAFISLAVPGGTLDVSEVGGGGFPGCHACLELFGLGLEADIIFGAPGLESNELGHLRGVLWQVSTNAAAAKSLQSCLTLCDPIDGSPPGSAIPGILQARTLEWVAISSSNAWKCKVKVKSLSHVPLFMTPRTAAYQAPPSMGFSRQEYWSGVPLPSPQHKWRGFKMMELHSHGSGGWDWNQGVSGLGLLEALREKPSDTSPPATAGGQGPGRPSACYFSLWLHPHVAYFSVSSSALKKIFFKLIFIRV